MKQKSRVKNSPKFWYIALFCFSAFFFLLPILLFPQIRHIKSLGLLGIGIINFVASASVFPTPGFLAVGIGGKIYNPLLVALVSAIGSSLGQSVGYIFGYSTKKLTASQKNVLNIVEKLFHHQYTWLLIVLLAFIPNPFFDIVGIVAGISLYSPKKFIFWVFLGRFLRDLLIAYIGHVFL